MISTEEVSEVCGSLNVNLAPDQLREMVNMVDSDGKDTLCSLCLSISFWWFDCDFNQYSETVLLETESYKTLHCGLFVTLQKSSRLFFIIWAIPSLNPSPFLSSPSPAFPSGNGQIDFEEFVRMMAKRFAYEKWERDLQRAFQVKFFTLDWRRSWCPIERNYRFYLPCAILILSDAYF